jgi:hypothetical protein
MYPPPLEPSHPSQLGKMGSELRSDPSQSRHKRVTPSVTKQPARVGPNPVMGCLFIERRAPRLHSFLFFSAEQQIQTLLDGELLGHSSNGSG